jgi:hypothetical protein
MAERDPRDEQRPQADQRPDRPSRSPGNSGSQRPYAKRDGDKKPYAKRDGDKKPYAKRDGDKKPYAKRDGDAKPYGSRDGGSKPYGKRDGDKKPYPKRDGDSKPYGNRDTGSKPYGQRDGEKRPYQKRDGDARPYTPRDGEKRPYTPRDGDKRPYTPRDGDKRPYTPRDGDKRPYQKRDGDARPYGRPGGDRHSGASRGGPSARPTRGGAGRPDREVREGEIRAVREHHDDPHIPDDITPQDLNAQARNELKTLSKENAEWVARHLAMAANLIDEDPALAHQHALSASRRAGRIAVVRETLAITAYATGDYALALRELRTYRRISGSEAQIALMVDSERGVGRPDRALEVGRGVDRNILPVPVRVELAIAMSGARLDLGEPERALAELDIPEFEPDRAYEWSPGLFSARATVLEELGRDAEAAEWHRRAAVAADAIDEANGIADLEVVFVEEIFEEGGDDDDAEEPVSNVELERNPDVEAEAATEQDTHVESELHVPGDDDGATVDPEPEPSSEPESSAEPEPEPQQTVEDEVREILIEAGVDEQGDDR